MERRRVTAISSKAAISIGMSREAAEADRRMRITPTFLFALHQTRPLCGAFGGSRGLQARLLKRTEACNRSVGE